MPVRCPTCQRGFEPAESPAMPFCSQRCREIDLGRWLDEKVGLPVIRNAEEEEPPPDGSDPHQEHH